MDNGKKSSLFHEIKIAYYKRFGKRRRYVRVPLRIKVTEKTSGIFEYFLSTNISAGGMFLKCERPYAVGANIVIEFSLPGNKKPVVVEAQVIRATPPGNPDSTRSGMGIQFTKVSPEDLNAIEDFVNKPGIY